MLTSAMPCVRACVQVNDFIKRIEKRAVEKRKEMAEARARGEDVDVSSMTCVGFPGGRGRGPICTPDAWRVRRGTLDGSCCVERSGLCVCVCCIADLMSTCVCGRGMRRRRCP
jgi:hypothetical protein